MYNWSDLWCICDYMRPEYNKPESTWATVNRFRPNTEHSTETGGQVVRDANEPTRWHDGDTLYLGSTRKGGRIRRTGSSNRDFGRLRPRRNHVSRTDEPSNELEWIINVARGRSNRFVFLRLHRVQIVHCQIASPCLFQYCDQWFHAVLGCVCRQSEQNNLLDVWQV